MIQSQYEIFKQSCLWFDDAMLSVIFAGVHLSAPPTRPIDAGGNSGFSRDVHGCDVTALPARDCGSEVVAATHLRSLHVSC